MCVKSGFGFPEQAAAAGALGPIEGSSLLPLALPARAGRAAAPRTRSPMSPLSPFPPHREPQPRSCVLLMAAAIRRGLVWGLCVQLQVCSGGASGTVYLDNSPHNVQKSPNPSPQRCVVQEYPLRSSRVNANVECVSSCKGSFVFACGYV